MEPPTSQSIGPTDRTVLSRDVAGVATVRLNAFFPCCKGRAAFLAIESVPREQYERTCSRCLAQWTIERRTLREEPGKRLDILEWLCTRSARR